MREEQDYISIGFNYTDRFGNSYTSNSTVEVIDDFDSELDIIGRQMNTFLGQVGYVRHECHMLMDDVSEDERAALEDYLQKYRENYE